MTRARYGVVAASLLAAACVCETQGPDTEAPDAWIALSVHSGAGDAWDTYRVSTAEAAPVTVTVPRGREFRITYGGFDSYGIQCIDMDHDVTTGLAQPGEITARVPVRRDVNFVADCIMLCRKSLVKERVLELPGVPARFNFFLAAVDRTGLVSSPPVLTMVYGLE